MNPSFETAIGWQLSGYADYFPTVSAYSGSKVGRLNAVRSSLGPVNHSSQFIQTVPVTPLLEVNLSAQVRVELIDRAQFWVMATEHNQPGNWHGIAVYDETNISAGGWSLMQFGTYIPTTALIDLSFTLFIPGTTGSAEVWLDDAGADQGGATVAVMGFELALRAMLGTLQANLNSELTAVGNEANDTLTPPAIDAWYCWRREENVVSRAACEVYEVGGTTLDDWNSQVSAWTAGSRLPLRMKHSLEVSVTFANRGLNGQTMRTSEMKVLAMRYVIAIIRTVRNFPDLGQTGRIIAEPGEAVMTFGGSEPDTPPGAMRVTVPFVIETKESSASETVVGGGPRPSAILES